MVPSLLSRALDLRRIEARIAVVRSLPVALLIVAGACGGSGVPGGGTPERTTTVTGSAGHATTTTTRISTTPLPGATPEGSSRVGAGSLPGTAANDSAAPQPPLATPSDQGAAQDPAGSPSPAVASPVPAGTALETSVADDPPAPVQTPVPVVTLPPLPVGDTYTIAEAEDAMRASIGSGDLAGAWSTTSDVTYDNAAAAAGNAETAALIARCGRLLGRIVELRPVDVIGAFTTYAPVSVLTQLTAYETADGAVDCTADLRRRYLDSGQLAGALGVFTNPAAVEVRAVDFPTVGDESFAATLTGQVKSGVYVVNVTVYIVLFRIGNLRGTLAVTRSALAPGDGAVIVAPLLNLFLGRIAQHR